ncbi:MAG: GNAT family N-acetyltransferase [Firmicutes bacterium]|nr:GNAT family N-acetyltransferase [Bacillota bacterium]
MTCRTFTPDDRPALAAAFGEWILHTDVMHFDQDSHTVGAFEGDTPVGFISVYPKKRFGGMEAYIDVIEVAESRRRQGVARTMLAMSADWARARGCRRLRAWSTADKTEAIAMWRALGYRLRPVYARKRLTGYYVTKRLKGERP